MQILRYLSEQTKVAMLLIQGQICTISLTPSTMRSTRIWCKTRHKKSQTQCSRVVSNPTEILRAGQEVDQLICWTQRTLPQKWFITAGVTTFWIAGRISITIIWAVVPQIKAVIQSVEIKITIFSSMISGSTKADCLMYLLQTIYNQMSNRTWAWTRTRSFTMLQLLRRRMVLRRLRWFYSILSSSKRQTSWQTTLRLRCQCPGPLRSHHSREMGPVRFSLTLQPIQTSSPSTPVQK